MSMKDHFFGPLYSDRDTGELSQSLRQAVSLARLVGAEHFTAQVRRMLSQHRHFALTDGTSAPELPELLRLLQVDQIGLVKLDTRRDLDEGQNLTCHLVFVEGVLEVRACWTGYKDIRAFELVDTLLRPLVDHGLAPRTFLVQGKDELPLPTDPGEMFLAVMRLHGESFVHGASGHGALQSYVDRITGTDSRADVKAEWERQARG